MKETKVEDYRIEKIPLEQGIFQVTITMAAEAGQLELNAFEPIVFYCMFQSIDTLAYAVHTFVETVLQALRQMRHAAAIWLKTVWASSQPSARMSAIRKLPILQRRP